MFSISLFIVWRLEASTVNVSLSVFFVFLVYSIVFMFCSSFNFFHLQFALFSLRFSFRFVLVFIFSHWNAEKSQHCVNLYSTLISLLSRHFLVLFFLLNKILFFFLFCFSFQVTQTNFFWCTNSSRQKYYVVCVQQKPNNNKTILRRKKTNRRRC